MPQYPNALLPREKGGDEGYPSDSSAPLTPTLLPEERELNRLTQRVVPKSTRQIFPEVKMPATTCFASLHAETAWRSLGFIIVATP